METPWDKYVTKRGRRREQFMASQPQGGGSLYVAQFRGDSLVAQCVCNLTTKNLFLRVPGNATPLAMRPYHFDSFFDKWAGQMQMHFGMHPFAALSLLAVEAIQPITLIELLRMEWGTTAEERRFPFRGSCLMTQRLRVPLMQITFATDYDCEVIEKD